MDTYDRPWMPESLKNPKPKSRKGQSIAVPIQGKVSEFTHVPSEMHLCLVSNLRSSHTVERCVTILVITFTGVEFMMSTQAFFCRLCKVFSGDASCAEHHLKSEEHYKTYQVLLEDR